MLSTNRSEEHLNMAAEFGIFGAIEPAQIAPPVFVAPTHPLHKHRLMRRCIAVTDITRCEFSVAQDLLILAKGEGNSGLREWCAQKNAADSVALPGTRCR